MRYEAKPHKKEEVKTYQELKLGRTFKSKAKRTRAERSGVFRILGGDDPTRPHLRVLNQKYLETRAEVSKEFLSQARNLEIPASTLLKFLTPQIELKVYERLALQQQQAARLESTFIQKFGRQLTAEEKLRFKESGMAPAPISPRAAFSGYRQSILDEVLAKVQHRQIHNPTQYRTAWTEAVGLEISQQSHLEKIDKTNCVAYFRCVNSGLSHKIQHDPVIKQKLSKSLGFPVKQLRVLF
jgi:hypothetical protein